jgi:predicted TPR repeat methyltransferase
MNIIQKIKELKTKSVSFFSNSYKEMLDNLMEMSVKCKDLRKTNIDLAHLHLVNGNFSDAILRYWILIHVLKHEDFSVYYNQGLSYLFNDSPQKALECFLKAKKFNSRNALCKFRIESLTHPDSIKEIPTNSIIEDYNIQAKSFKNFIKNNEYIAPQVMFSELKDFINKDNLNAKFNPLNILDIGCGYGLCGYLAKEEYGIENIFGIDIASEMVKEASSLNAQEKSFKRIYLEDFHNFKHYESKFDIVLACFSLQFSLDLKHSLKQIKDIAKKGTYIAIALPHKAVKDSYFCPNHRYFIYSRQDIDGLVEHSKFSDHRVCVKSISKTSEALIIIAKI